MPYRYRENKFLHMTRPPRTTLPRHGPGADVASQFGFVSTGRHCAVVPPDGPAGCGSHTLRCGRWRQCVLYRRGSGADVFWPVHHAKRFLKTSRRHPLPLKKATHSCPSEKDRRMNSRVDSHLLSLILWALCSAIKAGGSGAVPAHGCCLAFLHVADSRRPGQA